MSEILTDQEAGGVDGMQGQYLTFSICDVLYGVELLRVIDIIMIQSITHVPHLPNYIKGIINLRGSVVPVIDARIKLNQEEAEYDDKNCIIILDINGPHVGMIVDRVAEVVSPEPDDLSIPPKVEASGRNHYLTSVANIDKIGRASCRERVLRLV